MTPLTTIAPKVIVTRPVAGSKAKIWSALTDPSEMNEWYFDCIKDFKAKVGFTTDFKVSNGDRTFTHLWTVVSVVPFDKLSYSWKFAEYPGVSVSNFDIIDTAEGFSVCVTCDIELDFPADISEFTVESCRGGWEYFLDRLAKYLES